MQTTMMQLYVLPFQKKNLWACAPSKDSDQTVQMQSLIWIFPGRIFDSQAANFFHADNEDPTVWIAMTYYWTFGPRKDSDQIMNCLDILLDDWIQQRFRSEYSFAQSDLNLPRVHFKSQGCKVCSCIPWRSNLQAAMLENILLDICAQWRLRSACAFTVWSKSSLGAFCIAKDAKFLQVKNEDFCNSVNCNMSENILWDIYAQKWFRSACTFMQSDQNLHWVHFG